MRTVIAAAILLVITAQGATAEAMQLTAAQQKQFQQAAMRLVMADQCDRKFDDPDLFAAASAAFLATVRELKVPDSDSVAAKAIAKIRDEPSGKQATGPITLINPKMCGAIRDVLGAPKP